MSPAPELVQALPAVALQVQVNPAPDSAAGSGSLTAAPMAAPGPAFVTVTV
jgi:hypothetical protein